MSADVKSDEDFDLPRSILALRAALYVPPTPLPKPGARSVSPPLSPKAASSGSFKTPGKTPSSPTQIPTLPKTPRSLSATRELISEYEACIRDLRTAIMATSKKNFQHERRLTEMEKKIKLLIKNKLDTEIAQEVKVAKGDQKEDATFREKRAHYELLFRHLQSNPQYFAAMARHVNDAKNAATFVQTVVFDMYGDQYGDRDERLLLLCFRHALKTEILETPDLGSLFRGNTAVTQMLSAYAKRGQGLSVLRSVLEQPLRALTGQADLNLEISPQLVFLQWVTDQELAGTPFTGNRNVTDEEALQNPEVSRIVNEHLKTLLEASDNILSRIIEGVNNIPNGMRWICKQLGELCRKRFPGADRYQIGSIMGGYINLRFFNPVIVAPDALNFIPNKPSRTMRRNLVLIAKVLQNLSNGIEFGDKEEFMALVNPFIRSRREKVQSFFEELARVEDLDDIWEIDKFQEHESNKPITLLLSQIYLCHNLLDKNIDKLCPAAAPEHAELRKLVEQLGPPKPFAEEMTVSLQVVPIKRTAQIFASDLLSLQLDPKQSTMLTDGKEMLLTVLLMLPENSIAMAQGWALIEFLEKQKVRCAETDQVLSDKISDVITAFKTLRSIGILLAPTEARPSQSVSYAPPPPDSPSTTSGEDTQAAETKELPIEAAHKKSLRPGSSIPPDAVQDFMVKLVREYQSANDRLRHLAKRWDLIQGAYSSLEKHHDWLVGREEMFQTYLDNVKKGGTVEKVKPVKTKAEKFHKPKIVKFTAEQLLKDGLISKIEPEVDKKYYKSINFKFSQESLAVFKVEVTFKGGFELSVLDQPIQLHLEDLLRMSEENENSLYFDPVTLNTNILIHFLNHHFGAKK